MNPAPVKDTAENVAVDPGAGTPRRVVPVAGLGRALVRPEPLDPGYSYRSVARLSGRRQERTWPATAQ